MIKNNKIITSLTLAFALASCTFESAMAADNKESSFEVLDSTAAVVNNAIITENELNEMVASIEAKYKNHGANVDPIDIRRQALQALITRSIILQMAATGGMRITDMQLDSTLEHQDRGSRRGSARVDLQRGAAEAPHLPEGACVFLYVAQGGQHSHQPPGPCTSAESHRG